MMKAAILIGGMYREFDTAIKMCEFESIMDCDYYMSTVTNSIQKYQYNDEYKEFDVKGEMITNLIPNCVYEIFDESERFEANIANTNKMFYHWKNAFRLMKESNIKYDIIFLTRSDNVVTIKPGCKNLNWLPLTTCIYGDPIILSNINPFEFAAHDRSFFGLYEPMSKFLNGLPDTSKNIKFDCHLDLANCIMGLGYYVSDQHPFSHCIIRPQ